MKSIKILLKNEEKIKIKKINKIPKIKFQYRNKKLKKYLKFWKENYFKIEENY